MKTGVGAITKVLNVLGAVVALFGVAAFFAADPMTMKVADLVLLWGVSAMMFAAAWVLEKFGE